MSYSSESRAALSRRHISMQRVVSAIREQGPMLGDELRRIVDPQRLNTPVEFARRMSELRDCGAVAMTVTRRWYIADDAAAEPARTRKSIDALICKLTDTPQRVYAVDGLVSLYRTRPESALVGWYTRGVSRGAFARRVREVLDQMRRPQVPSCAISKHRGGVIA